MESNTKIPVRSGLVRRVLSFALAIAMILTLVPSSLFSVKAHAATVESPVIVKNADGTYDVTFQYGGAANSVGVRGTIPGANWNNDAVAMTKGEDGVWSVRLSGLASGTYEYKFVLNGSNWIRDPGNPLSADPSKGDSNNLLVLEEKPVVTDNGNGTSKVTLRYAETSFGGAVNSVEVMGTLPGCSWNINGSVQMTRTAAGSNIWWATFSSVQPGNYEYKFVVNAGTWTDDPSNPGSGGGNSRLTVAGMPDFVSPEVNGNQVTFRYWSVDANRVQLAGEMTNWATNAIDLTKGADSIWSTTLTLDKGTYEYKFILNGGTWVNDQKNQAFSSSNDNNIVTVTSGSTPGSGSPEVNGRQVTFRYTNASANTVNLAGTMNDWSSSATPMTKDADGVWTLTLTLSPGVYEYKFVLNGSTWVNDPNNHDLVNDNNGGNNNRFVVAGLADADLVVQKGETAELPATLALVGADGSSSSVAPTYALKNAVSGVTLSGRTLTVTSACTASQFVVTATSGSYTSEVTVHVVSAAYTYNVHFFDWNAEHMSLDAADLWAWEVGGGNLGAIPFTETVEIEGKTWLKATVTCAATQIGLIPRSKGGWTWQTPDHIFQNSDKKSVCNVYIVYGDDNTYDTPPQLGDEQGRDFYVPGTFPGPSWDAGSNKMTWDEANAYYSYTFKNVPAANYEFKIAVNATWDENYGVGGERDGANYGVTVPSTQDVTVYYSDVTHLAVTSVNYKFIDAELKGTGIETGTKLTDAGLTGIYSVTVTLEPGVYSDLTLFVDGAEYGLFTPFTLEETKDVTFYYAPVYDIYYHDAVASDEEAWQTVTFDSKDTAYKSVYGAVATGEEVTFSLTAGTAITGATLVISGCGNYTLEKAGEPVDGIQKWSVTVSDLNAIGEYDYFFVVSQSSAVMVYSDDDGYYGTGAVTALTDIHPYDLVVYKAGYYTPDWMKNAVIYQIFPDRFFNGDTSNDRAQLSARGAVNYEFLDWNVLPENPEQETPENEAAYKATGAHWGDGEWSNEIYGGDLKGITKKIGYLKALGVNVIYLNPVFSSISSHRYDTSDYTKIDPILGDLGDFTELVTIAEANGMHIVLDGVFNHVSDDSKYFDRYYKFLEAGTDTIGAYPYWAYVYDYMAEKGVEQSAAEAAAKTHFESEYGITNFAYTTWFDIFNTAMGTADSIGQRVGKPVYSYDGWWGYDSMPIIKATNGSEYQTKSWADEIIDGEGSVTQYWLSQGSDGWRLDVANEVSDETWQHFRDSVRSLNSEAVIIGEIWDDATKYLMGDMYDSVMNYMFRNAVTSYAMGGSSADSMKDLERLRERYPQQAFYAMMNLVGSHDTTRILSYLDGIPDDRNDKSLAAAFPTYEGTSDLAKKRQYLVAFLQYTYAGAPTVYYGDERGLVGADDPDDRRTIDWTKVDDENLLLWYAKLGAIRNSYAALRTGSVEPIEDATGSILGYVRRDENDTMLVLANNAQSAQNVTVAVTDEALTDLISGAVYNADGGKLTVSVPALSGVILTANAKAITVDEAALLPGAALTVVVDGSDVWTEGSDLTFKTNVSGDEIAEVALYVTIDGETVKIVAQYTVTTDGRILLSDAFLAELLAKYGPGTYTLQVTSGSGQTATTTFTLTQAPTPPPEATPTPQPQPTTKPQTPGSIPATGDNSPLGLLVIWTSVSFLGLAVLLCKKRDKAE